jgi:predicted RND superfamily exporter protein
MTYGRTLLEITIFTSNSGYYMWAKLAEWVLRLRVWVIALITGLTVLLYFSAREIQISYDFKKLIPADDPDNIYYENFKKQFGEDGSVMVIGIKSDNLFDKGTFNSWCGLANDIAAVDGVKRVLSFRNLVDIVTDSVTNQFRLDTIVKREPQTQEEVNVIRDKILSLPFYKQLVYSTDGKTTLMAITLDTFKLNRIDRIELVTTIQKLAEKFQQDNKIETHLSGLPLIRTMYVTRISKEVQRFIILGFIVTALILLLFFRSFSAVVIPIILVAMGGIWSVAFIVLFGFKITMLTGLIPSIIIVVGVPNSIYFLNKYHYEFRRTGDKPGSLKSIISRVGIASLLANSTTAIGFGVFYFSGTQILKEFGIVASLSIMCMYIISLVMVPCIFSFLPSPSSRQTKHLDNRFLQKIVEVMSSIVFNHRGKVYIITGIILVIALGGFFKLRSVGYMVDDLPKKDKIVTDLNFFEKNFGGVMPYEILVDTKKRKGIRSLSTLYKVDTAQMILATYPEFARPISVIELLKFSKQAFYMGDSSMYSLPDENEIAFMSDLIGKHNAGEQILRAMIDSNQRFIRISAQMADVGSNRIEVITKELRHKLDSLFPKDKYDVNITGTSYIFLKGNAYMEDSLVESLILAFILITLIMVYLFRTWKMVIISIVPNLIPIIITIGLMGYLGIRLKPSTILIFSIAYGLSSDFTIYFLNRYRHEFKLGQHSISQIISNTIRETGVSMLYTAFVLFFGFIIYTVSSFGGTISMGILISFTLIVAVISNLLFLPSLLLWLEKSINKKTLEQGLEFEE